MIPAEFSYHRPESVDDAVRLIAELGEDTFAVAGGHSLIPMMKLRLAAPQHLVDLRKVAGLRGIRVDGDEIVIGAMTSQQDLLTSPELAQHCPIIPETSAQIADPQIRSVGTLGGNVANGDPGNDMPAVMQCLNAVYTLQGPHGTRQAPARDFYEGAYATLREPEELLTEVRIPVPPAAHGYAYEKLKRKVGDYAIAAAAVVLVMEGDSCRSASVALTNVSEVPLMVPDAVAALEGSTVDAAAIKAAAEACIEIAEPAADGRGPEDYRKRMAGVMATRAIQRARERAGK